MLHESAAGPLHRTFLGVFEGVRSTMPAVTNIRPIEYSPEEPSWTRREYPSPDGKRMLVLHDAFEWHMGATGWKLSLFEDGRDVTRWHAELRRRFFRWPGSSQHGTSDKGFDCPIGYSPWHRAGRVLILCNWEDNPLYIYDVVEGRRTDVEVSTTGSLFFAHWDPSGDHALVVFSDRALIVDLTGAIIKTIPLSSSFAPTPHAYWLLEGGAFFILQRDGASLSNEIRFYDGEGALTGGSPLDPLKLIPYDEERYSSVSRQGFTLKHGAVTSVGKLLDTWSDARYDQKAGTLRLAVYRPVGETYRDKRFGDLVSCEVEQKWIECQVSI